MKKVLLNTALVLLILVVGVLAYAFTTQQLTARTAPLEQNRPIPPSGDIIQVEVRNGCGVSGLAGTLALYLRDQGFDVVEVGDYASFDEEQSLVIDRVGQPETARAVARALGLPEDRIRQEVRLDYYLDASVVIGRDYALMQPFATQ